MKKKTSRSASAGGSVIKTSVKTLPPATTTLTMKRRRRASEGANGGVAPYHRLARHRNIKWHRMANGMKKKKKKEEIAHGVEGRKEGRGGRRRKKAANGETGRRHQWHRVACAPRATPRRHPHLASPAAPPPHLCLLSASVPSISMRQRTIVRIAEAAGDRTTRYHKITAAPQQAATAQPTAWTGMKNNCGHVAVRGAVAERFMLTTPLAAAPQNSIRAQRSPAGISAYNSAGRRLGGRHRGKRQQRVTA